MNPINSDSLPEPLARYIDSVNRFDSAAAAECFAPDATVRDERKEHVGRPAIERWIAQTSQAYQPHVTVTSIAVQCATAKTVSRVAGNFSGSPIDLDYEFHLQDGKIARLTIG